MIAAAIVFSTLAQASVSFTTIEQGPLSGIETARHVVVRTESEWRTLWREHQPDREEPRVDFSHSMIVALFMGSRRTAGYAIDVTRVERSDAGLTVYYRESMPSPGAITAQILTAPFHIVRLDRVLGEVRFQLDTARGR